MKHKIHPFYFLKKIVNLVLSNVSIFSLIIVFYRRVKTQIKTISYYHHITKNKSNFQKQVSMYENHIFFRIRSSSIINVTNLPLAACVMILVLTVYAILKILLSLLRSYPCLVQCAIFSFTSLMMI